MKTYESVIKKLAARAFSNYMGGSNMPWYDIDLDTVATIYEKDYDEVDADVDAEYERIMTEYYASVKK